jgi:uncharacterized protein (DUF1778 family)
MTKDEVLNLRVPTEVKSALRRAAAEDERSASSMALKVIKHWLVANDYLAPPKASPAPRRSRPRPRKA